jgi:multidrug resistance efflux pump
MTQQALNLEQATNNYNSARAAYDQAIAGASQDQIQQSRASVEQARASLQKLLDSPTPAELASAESQLAQAAGATGLGDHRRQQRADRSGRRLRWSRPASRCRKPRDNLEKASLRAPFAGVITAVHVPKESRPAVWPSRWPTPAAWKWFSERGRGRRRRVGGGQPVVVTLETWPGQTIQGRVVSIAPKATAGSSGIASYEVRVALNDTDLPVRIGMTADADLIIDGPDGCAAGA